MVAFLAELFLYPAMVVLSMYVDRPSNNIPMFFDNVVVVSLKYLRQTLTTVSSVIQRGASTPIAVY